MIILHLYLLSLFLIINYDKINFSVGSPGSKRGYSGAPVFNYFGYLTGILLGGTSGLNIDTTIRECLESSAEQKYARILGISVIIYCYNLGRSNNES